ncbi:MAG: trypsin-like serine protease [Myxococcota bacterium]
MRAHPLPALALLLLASGPASAVLVRDDVPDEAYRVDRADHPALVVLFEPDDCAATLIDPSHLLTVAHCAVDVPVGFAVSVAGEGRTVGASVLHGRWRDRDDWDIAVLELDSPVSTVAPVPLYRGDDELGATVALLGTGVTGTGLTGEEGGSSDGVLRRATNVVTAVDDQVLTVRFDRPDEPGVTDLEGVGASGDSGGPVLWDIDGTPTLVGLNAFGDEGNRGLVGEYGALDHQTRVSRFVDWIDAVVAGEVPDEGRGCSTVPTAPTTWASMRWLARRRSASDADSR